LKDSNVLFRRLTAINTGFTLVAVILAIVFVAAYRQPILRVISGFLETEVLSSQFVSAVKGKFSPSNAPLSVQLFELKIPEATLRQFEIKSQKLAKKGYMDAIERLWGPAQFFADGRKYKVKIRLRGDLPNHWKRSKKSWRIRFSSKNLFQGRRTVDLIIPEDKQYAIEHAAYMLAQKWNLLVPPSGFSHVKINNVDYGLYFWSERLSKHSLERLGYAAGEIITDSDSWRDNYQPRENSTFVSRRSQFEQLPAYYKFRSKNNAASPHIASRFQQLLSLLSNADDLTLAREIDQILDLEKFAVWNAIAWSFGSAHAQYSYNLRWYYDTSTGKFEPILYDLFIYPAETWGWRVSEISSFEQAKSTTLVKRILQIPKVQMLRNKYLWRMLKNLDANVLTPTDKIYHSLRRFAATGVDKKYLDRVDQQHAKRSWFLRASRDALQDFLEFARVFVNLSARVHDEKIIFSFKIVPDGMANLQIKNIRFKFAVPSPSFSPLSVTFGMLGAETMRPLAADVVTGENEIIISPINLELWVNRDKSLAFLPTHWALNVSVPKDVGEKWLQPSSKIDISMDLLNLVTGKALAEERIRISSLAFENRSQMLNFGSADIDAFLNSTSIPFVREGDTLVLEQGTYSLDQDIVLPSQAALHLNPGVIMRMGPGVSLLTYRPIVFRGTSENPVTIEPQDETRPWGSIGVISADGQSQIDHTIIRGGSEDWVTGIQLTGQLSFHNSDVSISNSMVSRAHGDDGINVKHAKIDIRDSTFKSNQSDGFDGDWVQGKILRSRFENNRGDGIDLAGSNVTINRTLFSQMGDKGLSVGEASKATIIHSMFERSNIGVAVKDLSSVRVHSGSFYMNDTAVSAYQKKPAFGGAHGAITGALFWKNGSNFLVDEKSRIKLAGAGIEKWQKHPRISETELRVGEIESEYQYIAGDGIRFVGKDGSIFYRGPRTKEELSAGEVMPDLSHVPVGMGQ
jgi:hypothetical protein